MGQQKHRWAEKKCHKIVGRVSWSVYELSGAQIGTPFDCFSAQNLPEGTQWSRRVKMRGGGGNKKVLLSFVILMFLGIAVYFRLWTIDYRVSSDETELIRRQFDLANREAMDESAEWRLKYDVEAERSTKCMNELKQIKGSLEEDGNATNINLKLVMQQKENVALAEQIEALKQELETEKLKCRLQ
uniref:uncharacterized protein LOC101312560 n=1 Tax=Fragaria vesca subsp. vesca TaxID=101020 RepID=UPI0005CA14D3|nr:PREDICTED: uncharacterized protein LOC101312560 [Fragaria vesca subsp. vesca]